MNIYKVTATAQKSFPLSISSENVTKSAVFTCAVGTCFISNPYLETFFVIIYKKMVFVRVCLQSINLEPLQQCLGCIF